jgi:hypothetical protein
VALEPDALVVFASNNWHPFTSPTADELLDVAAALREKDSWRGVKEFVESSLTVKAEQTLRSLGDIISQRGIPVVFVVPEFNQNQSEASEEWQKSAEEIHCKSETAGLLDSFSL